MGRAEIRIESEAAFFDRVRAHGKQADRGAAITPSHVIAFGDLETLLRVTERGGSLPLSEKSK